MIKADFYYYYCSEWFGTLDNGKFSELLPKALRYVDYYTQHRIEEATPPIKNAVCAVVEVLHEYDTLKSNLPVGIKNESIDGVSVSYSTMTPSNFQKDMEKAVYTVIKKELSGTNLLFRGVIK